MTAGPPSSIHSTSTSSMPSSRACFSIKDASRMTYSGRNPTPPAPSGIRTKLPARSPAQPASAPHTARAVTKRMIVRSVALRMAPQYTLHLNSGVPQVMIEA